MEYTFFQAIEKGVRDACKDLGYKYIMIDQNQKATKMVNDLNCLVGQKVDRHRDHPGGPGRHWARGAEGAGCEDPRRVRRHRQVPAPSTPS